ncbi:MAG: M20 family metallopeptidase [Actinomycetota bacterium]
MTSSSQSRSAKHDVSTLIENWGERLVWVSHDIHDHPELNYAEHHAHDLLVDTLRDMIPGVAVTPGAYGIPTAFEAVFGDAGPEVLVLLEYDALPGIGHGCGHNVIAAAGLGAGLAAGTLAQDLGGRVRLLGTPAEEGGGGKIALARRGAFATGEAALMIHPADADLLRMSSIAIHTMDVTYEGRAAHAAAAPWEGRNALDAAVLGYMNVAALRQHIRPDERIHGIFTEAGEKPNIVPRRAAATWYVRSATLASLQPLKERVTACLDGAARACGCSMTTAWDDHAYADVRDNAALVSAYARNMAALGRPPADPEASGRRVVGSTDMGNVSYLMPSIHPMIKIAPDGVPIHTEEFAACARSGSADAGVLAGATAMAMTVIDIWEDASLRQRAREEFGRLEAIDVL